MIYNIDDIFVAIIWVNKNNSGIFVCAEWEQPILRRDFIIFTICYEEIQKYMTRLLFREDRWMASREILHGDATTLSRLYIQTDLIVV